MKDYVEHGHYFFDLKQQRPGTNAEQVLLWFPESETFLIWGEPWNVEGPFAVEKNGKIRAEKASHWMLLKERKEQRRG